MIGMRNLEPNLASLVSGLMVGNVYYVGTNGNDFQSGKDFKNRLKSIYAASSKLVTGNHDYILAFGSETGATSISISAANAHIIGASMPAGDTMGRGYAYTCPATVDTIIPATTADYLEIANIKFICNATDHILIDDAGCDDAFFHHNTVYGSTTASDAIRLDLEGARWTVTDNVFILCKLAIDMAGAAQYVSRNKIHDVDIAAKGIVFGAVCHYSICTHNTLNLTGGTGDVGVTIAASADNIELAYNNISASCNDPIADSGTATVMHHNYSTAVTGTSGASIQLVIIT